MCYQSTQAFPLRIWIVDNSGSMREPDGRRLVETSTKQNVRWTLCTRWDELKDTVMYHAQMAALLQAPTHFMLLNNPPMDNRLYVQMGVAEMGHDMVDEELESLRHLLHSTTPGGVTPLTRHLHNVYALVSSMLPLLQREGQRVVVVVATDGVPTNERGQTGNGVDRDFERALERLQELPIWLVVRLCTNDDKVVHYYQSLDDRLEWDLEVLDDFLDEAKEVYRYNPWLNYALPLHRCREWGFPNRLLDLLDERPLTCEEMSDFLQLLFCETHGCLPDPAVDWDEFVSRVRQLVDSEERPWNFVKNKPTAWINIKQLVCIYGPRNHRWLAALAVGGLFVLSVVWRGLSGVLSHVWQSLSLPPRTSWSEGSAWIVGGIALLLFSLSRRPPNARVVLAILGIIASLAFPSLWDKPRSFWEGTGWILGGLFLLLGVIAYNDR